jgi:hypothetical protein
MVATQHGKMPLRMGKCAFLDVFDPGTVHPEGHLVFFFACHTTRMATDAFAVVNQKSKFHGHSRRYRSKRSAIMVDAAANRFAQRIP